MEVPLLVAASSVAGPEVMTSQEMMIDGPMTAMTGTHDPLGSSCRRYSMPALFCCLEWAYIRMVSALLCTTTCYRSPLSRFWANDSFLLTLEIALA